MHGGIGMTDEFDIGFFIKRARVAQMLLTDATISIVMLSCERNQRSCRLVWTEIEGLGRTHPTAKR